MEVQGGRGAAAGNFDGGEQKMGRGNNVRRALISEQPLICTVDCSHCREVIEKDSHPTYDAVDSQGSPQKPIEIENEAVAVNEARPCESPVAKKKAKADADATPKMTPPTTPAAQTITKVAEQQQGGLIDSPIPRNLKMPLLSPAKTPMGPGSPPVATPPSSPVIDLKTSAAAVPEELQSKAPAEPELSRIEEEEAPVNLEDVVPVPHEESSPSEASEPKGEEVVDVKVTDDSCAVQPLPDIPEESPIPTPKTVPTTPVKVEEVVEPEHVVSPPAPHPSPESKPETVQVEAQQQLQQKEVVEVVAEAEEPEPEPEEDGITGTILEFERDEVSTPRGSRKVKMPRPVDFPTNKHWIKPEVLLEEVWDKRRVLRYAGDPDAGFTFPIKKALQGTTWEVQELVELKQQLFDVKSLLNKFPLRSWHDHTKRTGVANLVLDYVKKYYNAEFCTQAWGKMFEIACAFELVPDVIFNEMSELSKDKTRLEAGEQIPFDSVHLCEAPGAFIAALNHYIKNSFNIKALDWNWLATTLSPYHEGNNVGGKMINDDRLILKSMDHWTFLNDATGNILSNKNAITLTEQLRDKLNKPRIKKGQKSNRVLLVTADGSFDCQDDPAEQEGIVAHLQFGEIVTALKILQPGGSFLLKIFTFLEAPTICNLYLLSCAFKEVSFFKPSMSREGNSEVYVVCLKYLGDATLSAFVNTQLFPMIETYGDFLKEKKTLLPLEAIPVGFIERIKEAANYYCDYQMRIIKRNVSCFPCDTRVYQMMKPFRKEAAEQWLEWSEIKKLLPEERLFSADEAGNVAFSAPCHSHLDSREEHGCFEDKFARRNGDDITKLTIIRNELQNYAFCSGQGFKYQLVGACPIEMGEVEYEKAYGNILCSRFCFGRILSDREEIRQIAKYYLDELDKQGVKSMKSESFCSGHNTKQVIATVQKCCPLEGKKQVDVLCFKNSTWEFLTKTDFQLQQQDLSKILTTVKGMEKGRSLFLCRFPLLTRLQNGLILSLSGMFEKVIIYRDIEKMVIGVMLYKFTGVDQALVRSVEGVLGFLGTEEPVLQIAPMKTLLEFLPTEFILHYNLLLLGQDMDRIITVTECAIKFSLENKF